MAAISSGRPARFIGVMWPMRASIPRSRACSKTLLVIFVSTRPGRIALTRTPVPLKALAAHCARLFTAALAALYEIAPAFARSDAADEVKMIEPLPCFVIGRPAYFTARQ